MSAALRTRREPAARRDAAPAVAVTPADRDAGRHDCRLACCVAGRPVAASDVLSADHRQEDAS